MNNIVVDNVIKMGLLELYNKGKINLDIKTGIENYVDKNTSNNYYELSYSDLDQINSTGLTFTDASRKASNVGACVLRTNLINLDKSYIRNMYIKSNTAITATIQFSYDLLKWYNITLNANGTDITEYINAPIYLKISYSTVAEFYGMNLLYLTSCNN